MPARSSRRWPSPGACEVLLPILFLPLSIPVILIAIGATPADTLVADPAGAAVTGHAGMVEAQSRALHGCRVATGPLLRDTRMHDDAGEHNDVGDDGYMVKGSVHSG